MTTRRGVLFGLAAMFTLLPIRAWVLVKLWGWFPQRLGAPAIGWAMAGGLLVLFKHVIGSPIGVMTMRNDPPTVAERWSVWWGEVVYAALALGVGYVLHAVSS